MPEPNPPLSPARLVVILASVIIVVAGMQAASSIIVPFLCAAFLAVLSLPFLHWFAKRGLPPWLSLTCVLGGLIALAVLVLVVIGTSVAGFADEEERYKTSLQTKIDSVKDWLAAHDIPISDAFAGAADPGAILGYVGQALTQVGSLMSNTFIILLWLAFLLVEASGFGAKLTAISPDPERALGRVRQIVESINRYFSIKTRMSLGTGVAAGLLTWTVGVDFPVLWGFLAFLLNFVPNIGSVLAAVPPVLLALILLDPSAVVILMVGYAAINILIGSILEPRVMGRGLDLSTLVVFLSLVFWGWVLGPVGMLLSVPLTITLKIVLEAFPETKGIALMLGSGVPDSEGLAGQPEKS